MPKILIADDDKEVRDAMVRWVSNCVEDAVIEEAQRGNQAIHMLRKADPEFDLLITDYHMPMGNGIEVLQHLAGMGLATRAVLMSGDPPSKQTMELYGLGDVKVLKKGDKRALKELEELLVTFLGIWNVKHA